MSLSIPTYRCKYFPPPSHDITEWCAIMQDLAFKGPTDLSLLDTHVDFNNTIYK